MVWCFMVALCRFRATAYSNMVVSMGMFIKSNQINSHVGIDFWLRAAALCLGRRLVFSRSSVPQGFSFNKLD